MNYVKASNSRSPLLCRALFKTEYENGVEWHGWIKMELNGMEWNGMDS